MSIRRFNSDCFFFSDVQVEEDVYLPPEIDFNGAIVKGSGNCLMTAYFPPTAERRAVPYRADLDRISIPSTGVAAADTYYQIGGVNGSGKGVEQIFSRGETTYDTDTDEVVIGRDGLYTVLMQISMANVTSGDVTDWVFAVSEDSGATVTNIAEASSQSDTANQVTVDYTKVFTAGDKVSFYARIDEVIATAVMKISVITYIVEQRF